MSQFWWNNFAAIPYKDGGRDRAGVDCWGLVMLVYSEVQGVLLKDERSSGTPQEQNIKISAGKQTGDFVEIQDGSKPQDGDVVVLKVGGLACHVGVVCDGGASFIHTLAGAGTVIERLNSLRWKNRIDSFWRLHSA